MKNKRGRLTGFVQNTNPFGSLSIPLSMGDISSLFIFISLLPCELSVLFYGIRRAFCGISGSSGGFALPSDERSPQKILSCSFDGLPLFFSFSGISLK